MAIHQLKQNFTAGEVSPYIKLRTDFERYANGCSVLKNMVVLTQGPTTRRPATKFIYDISSLFTLATDPKFKLIPFVFNQTQKYVLIFFKISTGAVKLVFATDDGLLVSETTPSGIVTLHLGTAFDIDNFDYAQSGDYIFIAQPNDHPCVIQRFSHTSWVFSWLSFTNTPLNWNNDEGYPENVTLHQQRLIFGGSASHRQTIWASAAGDFYQFGQLGATASDADGFEFSLDSGTHNKIQWLHSSRSLMVGTMANEWTIIGGASTAITPTLVLAQQQTNHGSERIKPFGIGVTTLFVERHGRIINEFVYNYTYDNYETSDITVLAPHLTELSSICGWTYQSTPHKILWSIREDGVLLGLTYQRPHKVIAWHRHDTHQGYFKACACIPGDNREDEVWFIVKRLINGVYKYYLEKLDPFFTGTMVEEGRFLDCYVEYDGTPTTTVTGLSMFEGETVNILADGVVHPDRTVTSGSITLQRSFSHIIVGFNYISETRPLIPDIKLDDGTSLGRMSRITDVQIALYRSLGMTIGFVNEDNEEVSEDIPFRTPINLTGQPLPLFSGYRHISFPEGYDRDIEYFIRQTQPLPLTILGVIDKIEVYE